MSESNVLHVRMIPPPTWRTEADARAFLEREVPQIADALADLAAVGLTPPSGALEDLGDFVARASSFACDPKPFEVKDLRAAEESAHEIMDVLTDLGHRLDDGKAQAATGGEYEPHPNTFPVLVEWVRSAYEHERRIEGALAEDREAAR